MSGRGQAIVRAGGGGVGVPCGLGPEPPEGEGAGEGPPEGGGPAQHCVLELTGKILPLQVIV